ncbi:hypothetical protein jhhlp_004632 [Lomentospora prolificans]|uniref:GPI ethanolamine phosphate transferase 2 C-terminal domain-containing protein n=1 Tax=Lomentospora prolificans TaxID=41688 RepID=A0A2N3NC79_9PEZI|nr:hypothetical protein jhhlp_004632 [Lomentospora prolificans]
MPSNKQSRARKQPPQPDALPAVSNLPTQQESQATLDWVLKKNHRGGHAARRRAYEHRWGWTVAFWVWVLFVHFVGLLLFTNGFLLTRLVLDDTSECDVPPIDVSVAQTELWKGPGNADAGCWHPKSFNKAVVILIDALRYDFAVPANSAESPKAYHNALTFLHESAVTTPQNAVLRPFIADPPTSTLQRLKGLTTGTLPTFMDIGSSFDGTAIDEDNILRQMRNLDKKIVQLGDDTWWALFPGYFQPNESKAFDSFNVWDLHTVDNGVMDRIFPLMEPEKQGSWDLLIGHCLGVDHAGHRYGPDHPAMNAKLAQMDDFIRRLTSTIDEDTILIVMGDHGMDSKGDHGGESDDEIESTLWMYSKRPFFGRTKPEYAVPPETAKIRPVNQIDLVPTLSLLLGIPIPFNNLGRPIEEAFAGTEGNSWKNLATASRVAAAGTKRYQSAYSHAQKSGQDESLGSPTALWNAAEGLVGSAKAASSAEWELTYEAFISYQTQTLRLCKDLWARFDVPRMITGIATMATGVVAVLLYASRSKQNPSETTLDLHKRIVLRAFAGLAGGATAGLGLYAASFAGLPTIGIYYVAAAAALGSLLGVFTSLVSMGRTPKNLVPTSIWTWLSAVFTVSQSIGFAANSFTIWEDSISLFFLGTFGLVSVAAAFHIKDKETRSNAVFHSILFVVLARVASYSKLCREEQMPYCISTYYASSASSTSSTAQLAIPFITTITLPFVVAGFLKKTNSFAGWGKSWIGNGLPGLLSMTGLYWLIDAADNGDWFPDLPETLLKRVSVYVALGVLGMAFIAGGLMFSWGPPLVGWKPVELQDGSRRTLIEGYKNAWASRYLMLPVMLLVACILLSKPMGGGALAVMMWQVICLVEMVKAHGIAAEPIGPVVLGLLGNFHFFTTGHQAAISTIQWDSAFIPLFTIRMPWSALIIVINSFAGQIMAAVSVPLVVAWLASPDRKGLLETVSRAMAGFVSYFSVQSLATMMWAGHLRRHLMLYRVFSPRFMAAGLILLTVDVVGILVTLMGVRVNSRVVYDVFGYPE